ncbi:hypothetical protein GHT06_010287 [Daphnia sinensis]|uniref:Gustatory receptor n=1 Tax=Daphnia sinensis TaxID=1820382 RepID=A0AAD5PXC0_9CRUS|nr:hypothetical protein GHT06_010287 [Daphnia sinensis]
MAIPVSSSSREREVESTTINCWTWSIRPLIIWLRFLGVALPDVSTSSSLCHRWVMLAHGILCFSSHATGHIDILCYLFTKSEPGSLEQAGGSNYDTTTAKMNSIIDFVNYTVNGFGTHIIMLTVIRTRWIRLRNSFQRLEGVFVEENYIRIRNMSSMGVVSIILLIFGLTASSTGYHFAVGTSSTHRIFISFMATISIIYPLTALVLFFTHCYASSLAFESIQTEVKRNEIQLMNGREQDVSQLIFLFKERHILANETVDGINDSFGCYLLLATTSYFVSIINSTFYLFGLDNRISLPDIIFTLFVLFNLTVTCFAADSIQNKMNTFISEMAHTIPQISANGYFDVSRKLFPQVIGTTLTYFFILCQFEVSEKKLCPK